MKPPVYTTFPAYVGSCTIRLLAILALPGAILAGDDPSPAAIAPAGVQTNSPEDWTKTRLYLESALRAEVDGTNALLDDRESILTDEISRSRAEGHLDRRDISTIERAMDNARSAMADIAGAMRGDEQINGRTARMIAFELGMASDALAQQADKLAANLAHAPTLAGGLQGGGSAAPDERGHLAETLRTLGKHLQDTAHAIVRNLH